MDNQFSTESLIAKGSQASGGINASKAARWCMILATLGIVGYILWRWVLPMMVDIVWDVAQIAVVGIPTLLVVGFILSQRRNIFAFYDIMANKMFGKLVQMAPFRMQEKRIELAEKNYEQVQVEYGKLKGAYDRVTTEYNRQVELYNEGVAGEKIAKGDEDKYNQQKKQQRAGGFVKILQPQQKNMEALVQVVQLGLKRMKQMILDAKTDLAESKTVFEVTMTGAEAMAHMQSAMQGDAQVNSDAERATLAVMQRISLAVGQTQAAMEIVSDITKASNLEDASKLAVARQQLEQLGTSDIRVLPEASGSLHYQGMPQAMNAEYPL